jgi:hypothetical protein
MTIDEMKEAIKHEIVEAAGRLIDFSASDSKWTREILVSLGRLGKREDLDYFVCSHGFGHAAWSEGKDCGEWLHDQTWLDYNWDITPRQLKRMVMALESEWGNAGDILDDFEKLLVARADLRVMIFQADDADALSEIFRQLTEAERRCETRVAGDNYLLCGYDNQRCRFDFREIGLARQGERLMVTS